MPLPDARALVFAYDPQQLAFEPGLDALRRRGRYEDYSEEIPLGWPRPSPEIRELAWRRHSESGWVAVALEEPDRAHHWAKELSEAAPDAIFWGLAAFPLGRSCTKLYRRGHPVAKIGADPDRELFYPVPQAGQPQFEEAERVHHLSSVARARFRAAWESVLRGQLSADDSIAQLAKALAWPWWQLGYGQVASDPAWTRVCWVRRDSRLLGA